MASLPSPSVSDARRMARVEESKKAAWGPTQATFFLIASRETCGLDHPTGNATNQSALVRQLSSLCHYAPLTVKTILQGGPSRFDVAMWRFLAGNLPTYGDFHRVGNAC